jgi:MoxR-like ATPase
VEPPERAPVAPQESEAFAAIAKRIGDNIARAVQVRRQTLEHVLIALLAEGHVLVEDYPGVGKTALARAMARSIDCQFARVQCTSDLLPADVVGTNVYDQRLGQFEFRPGPVFANVVLVDEINRASPKTQSALLEVMEENRVTVDGVSHNVGRPFMVIATQNPIEQAGTYRLPEAQLDRFLMKTSVGYPDHEATVALLHESAVRDRTVAVHPVVTSEQISEMAKLAAGVHVDGAVLAYVSRLAEESRRHQHVKLGLSVRGCLAMVRSAKTWAASVGRNFVTPDDIKELAVPVLSHRILLDAEAQFAGTTVYEVIDAILATVVPPSERAA